MAVSSENYIPRPDGDFDAWVNQYFPAVDIWWKAQGLDTGELSALNQALEEWRVLYPTHVAAQAAAEAARNAKDQARQTLEAAIRPVTRFVQSYPTTTNADRATMGISVRTGRKAGGLAPQTRPVMVIQTIGRGTQQLRIMDESTPTRRGKPKGASRAEVFVAVTAANQPAPPLPPPGSAGDGTYRYMGSASGGTMRLEFPARQAGHQTHYITRWVGTKGALGPWSETASATIAA